MFGWFKNKPECPVSPKMRAWLEGRTSWIAHQFGIERLRNAPVVLPNDDFFPGQYEAKEEDVHRLFARVCALMGVDARQVDLRFYKVGDRRALTPFDDWAGTAGLYQDRRQRAEVHIEESHFGEPVALVAALAHELAHVLLHGDHRLEKNEEDGEHVTDLLAVLLGFGVFMANAASQSNVFLGLIEGRAHARLGYLTDSELSYALAIVAWLHSDDSPPWSRLVRPNVRDPMITAIRWLSETEPGAARPRGCRLDELGNADAFPVVRHPILAYFAADSAPPSEDLQEIDHFNAGLWAVTGGRYEEAVRELSLSIEEDPNDTEAYQQRALAFLGLDRVREALADAEKAVALAPEDVGVRCVRGKALVRCGRFAEAATDFEIVIAESDGSEGDQLAEAYFQRGLIRALENDLPLAVRDFSRAITSAPWRPEFYEARAAAYDRLGKPKKAQQDRKEAEHRRSRPPS